MDHDADDIEPRRCRIATPADPAIAMTLFLFGGIAIVAWLLAPFEHWRKHFDV